MKQKIQSLLSDLCTVAYQRLESDNKEFTVIVLKAYNRYQEDERDGVDYLADINNKDDVKCCLDGGLSIPEFVSAYFDRETHHFTSYFFFGVNHPKPSFIITKEQLAAVLQNSLADIMPHMFCNPNIKEYSALYEALVSDYMYDNEMV